MEQYHAILKQQEEESATNLLGKQNLVCRQLQFGNEAPLYLAKPHWTNRFDAERDTKYLAKSYTVFSSHAT